MSDLLFEAFVRTVELKFEIWLLLWKCNNFFFFFFSFNFIYLCAVLCCAVLCCVCARVTMQMYNTFAPAFTFAAFGWQNHEIMNVMLDTHAFIRALFSFSCIFTCLWCFLSYTCLFFLVGFLWKEGKKGICDAAATFFLRDYCVSIVDRRCRKMCECTIALAHVKINQKNIILMCVCVFFISFTHPLTPNRMIVYFFLALQYSKWWESFVPIIFKLCTPWLFAHKPKFQLLFRCISIQFIVY